jgi:Zn-dependent peptidase ImmA (M78 family)
MAQFNRAVLSAALESRRLSERSLSDRAGISYADFQRELDRESGPSQSLLDALGRELSIPPFMFYMREVPSFESNILDFRHPDPASTAKSRSTIESIQIAEAIQRQAKKLGYFANRISLPTLSQTGQDLKSSTQLIRRFFEIGIDDQISTKDARLFYYLCRQKIEAKQIFILQESFPSEDGSGYVLWDDLCPVIIINTHNQNYARRLFTLIHELAHVLLRQSGISDPFVRSNVTEQFCNRFAAEFLVPTHSIDDLLRGMRVPERPTTDDVKRIASRLKFSQEASVLRLEQLGRVAAGSYEAWLRAVSNFGNPDYKKQGGGAGGRPAEEKIKLAKYGFLFATTFERAIAESKISDIELYRIAGIKPKWQSTFFSYARSNDLESIEDD